jgi:metal-responsive CopG/Arc/MetJ family transcriptional regulator
MATARLRALPLRESTNEEPVSVSVGQLPSELVVELDELAAKNERSRAAELRIAVKRHLAKNGK